MKKFVTVSLFVEMILSQVGGQVVEYYKQALRSLDSTIAREQVPVGGGRRRTRPQDRRISIVLASKDLNFGKNRMLNFPCWARYKWWVVGRGWVVGLLLGGGWAGRKKCDMVFSIFIPHFNCREN